MSKRYSRRNNARLIVFFGIMMLSSNSEAPTGITQAEVKGPVIRQEVPNATKDARELAVWSIFVDVVAEKIGIKDRALAETVARALEDASSEFNVDLWIMVALIRVESAGDPHAVSRVGAMGLTQIMPETGREIASELGIENYSTKMLYNTEINIRMSTYYIRTLLDRFDGDYRIALAAYNWGPTHIAERISKRERLPVVYPSKILGRIPEQPAWVANAI